MLKSQDYKYLIYDDCNKDILSTFINLEKTKIIDFRNYKKTKYLIEFIKSTYLLIFNLKLIKILIQDGFFIAFICSQILQYKPSIVLTTTDNDLRFYKLKKYFGDKIRFIALQNGLRSKFHDIFDGIEKDKSRLSADYYFSFGSNISDYITKYINVKVIPIGSFKSNLIKKVKFEKSIKNKVKILFISSFRIRKKKQIFEIGPNKKKSTGMMFLIMILN